MMWMNATDNGRSRRAQLPGPMLVLLMLLASITTGNAFAPVAQPPRTSGRYLQIVSRQPLVLSAAQDEHGNDHHQHSCEPILLVEARPVVPHALMKRTASVATGTLLALSLFFAPVPTTSASTNNVFFGISAQPALAASKTADQAPATPETQVKSAKAVSAVSTPETQVKNAKAALAEATKRVKVADGKVKALDAALAKTEQSIIASEKAVQKTKEAVKQAEARYRDMQNQKKVGPTVLDKESMKVVNVKLGNEKALDGLTANKGKKMDLKTQAKVAGDELRSAQKAEQQAVSTLSTAEKTYASYQKQQAAATKAAEAKAKAKLALDQKKAKEKAALAKIEAAKAQAKAKAKLELEQQKAREKAAQEALAAAKAQKRLEGRKEQIQMQTRDLQVELKNLQQKRKRDNAPAIDAQIAAVQQKLDALKQASKELTSTSSSSKPAKK